MYMFDAIQQTVPKYKNNKICNFCSMQKCTRTFKQNKQNSTRANYFCNRKIVLITKVTKYVIFVSVKMQQERTKKTAQQQFKNKNYKFCNFCCSHTD